MSVPTPVVDPARATDEAVAEAIRRHLLRLLREGDPGFDAPLPGDTSFDALGLDSLTRVGLVQALEDEFGHSLEPGLAFDFVTIDALSAYVRARINGEAIDEKALLGI